MAILHVRGVPSVLHEQIRDRAEAEGRSVSAEVIVLLERAIDLPERSPQEVLAGIRRRRSFRPTDAGAPDSTTLLREDRAR